MTVPASLLVSSGLCVGTSACVSPGLAFYATFAVSLVFLARALSPEPVDGAFAHVDACVQRGARLARAAIGNGAQILGDVARRDPVVAPIYALGEERARRARASFADGVDGMKSTARAKWGGFMDAAAAAFFWFHLITGVINLAVTVLVNIAFEEARSRAPSVLGWRGVKGIIRSPPNEEAAVRRGSKPDTTLLVVWISAIVMYCTQVLVLDALCSGMTTFASFFACFAALCGFALMEAERVYMWDSYDIATTDISSSTVNQGRRVGNAAGGTAELDLQGAWDSLWVLIILTYFTDAVFLWIVLGKRPLALSSLAIFKLTALKLARQVYLTPDDGDGAQGDVNKWHRAAMVVLAIESSKVFITYLFIDFFLGALCFASLCATTAFLFDEAICLPDVHAPGDDDDNQLGAGLATDLAGDADGSDDVHNQECAGLARVLAGDAEGSDDVHNQECQQCDGLARDITGVAEGSDDVRAEDLSAEKEGSNSTTVERSDPSDSEEEAEELQRHEEPEYSNSNSMDDWSYVDVDPTMPVGANGGAGGKFSFLSMGVRG